MAVYRVDDIEDNEDIKDEGYFTKKFLMLKKIKKDGILVPEAIYADKDEYNYYQDNVCLSATFLSVITNFIVEIISQGHLPLISIRCEGKVGFEYNDRPPITIVNVGIEYILADENKYTRLKDWKCKDKALEFFIDRASKYEEFVLGKKHKDLITEISYWISIVYNLMKNTKYSGNKGIILQRMVMGSLSDKSGNGICCNWPGDINKENRFKGVFIPHAHGIPVIEGCWGQGELDLYSLKSINAIAYYKLYDIFNFLEEKYGNNPYLEFTVEGETVYILQYEVRQRFVGKGI